MLKKVTGKGKKVKKTDKGGAKNGSIRCESASAATHLRDGLEVGNVDVRRHRCLKAAIVTIELASVPSNPLAGDSDSSARAGARERARGL